MSDPANAPAPTCYRHPGRVTYVRCQRCGRPICADCQIQAAVGVQCPECVRSGAGQVKRPSRAASTWRRQDVPSVTYAIIAACVVVFIGQLTIPSLTNDWVYAPILTVTEPWRAFTSIFLHSPANFTHILFNMYSLWVLGTILEPMIGKGRFAALYLLSGLGGSLGVLLLADPRQSVLGASGAIFGLMGALVVLQRKMGFRNPQLYIVVAINLGIGFFFPGVAWQAHVGGLVIGAVVGLLQFMTRHDRTQLRLLAFEALVLVAIIAIAIWKLAPLIQALQGVSGGISS